MESRVTPVQRKLFQERIKKVNANRDTRTVWECIDRPIRPLIFEMARIGLIPKFSCCGYTYEDEEEPKTHHGSQAYVFFYAPEENFLVFNDFMKLVQREGWNGKFFNGFTWHIWTTNPVPDTLYKKDDGINEAIHQYEGYGLKIERLAVVLQQFFPTANDPVTIIDGNSMYKALNTWMVKPKKNFTIGVDEYYQQYGKIDWNEWKTTDEQRLGINLLTPDKIDAVRNKEYSGNTSGILEFQAQLKGKNETYNR